MWKFFLKFKENEARCSNASDCSMLSAGSRVAGLNVSIVTALPEEDENLTDEGDDSENQTPNGSESSSEKKVLLNLGLKNI